LVTDVAVFTGTGLAIQFRRVMDVLPASFPWVRYLPAHEMRRFSVELVETPGAAAELDNSAAVARTPRDRRALP